MTQTEFSARVPDYLERLQRGLDGWLLPAQHHPARLHEAMRYACDGGKRLRALLIYAAGEVLGVPARALDAPACAIELIHAYSLVHDDLPMMDDDDLRRGKPTVHKAFGETIAVLAGDGLQALAFHALAREDDAGTEPRQRLKMIDLLAEAAGSRGMVGGQVIDLQSESKTLTLAELEALHIHKTGALIRACLLMACHAKAPIDATHMEALDRYGKCVGLAFQIQDDVLDEIGQTSALGKTAGKDKVHQKSTYPAVMGLPAAQQRATDLFNEARNALSVFGERGAPLKWLSEHIQGRKR